MDFKVIEDDALVEELLNERDTTGYPAPEQFGPLRWYDKEMRCASRGCSSPTYLKVQGVPYCGTHALHKMNELLIQLGILE